MAEHRRTFEGPAEPALLDAVHEELAALWRQGPEVGEADRMLFETALAEVVANVASYSRSGTRVSLELAVLDDRLDADLVDDSSALPGDIVEGASMGDADAEHGRGLALAAAALDELTYRRRDGRNHWRLSRLRQRAD